MALRASLAALLALFCLSAFAEPNLACFQERRTLATTCVDRNAVTANGGTRAAPLYVGDGSQPARRLPYFLVTNCAKGVSILRDERGGDFEGDIASAGTALRVLALWMCEINNPPIDLALRQVEGSGQGHPKGVPPKP
jgi:hypothetical protein